MKKITIFLALFLISVGTAAAQQNLNYYNRNIVTATSKSKTTEDNLPIKVEHQMACTLVGYAGAEGIDGKIKDEKGFVKPFYLSNGDWGGYLYIERCENDEIICYIQLGYTNVSGHTECKFK